MRLTTFSDYALRVLMYAASAGDRLITIEETAAAYSISKTHLMKIVNVLARNGYLVSIRGRSGGFRLAMPPERVNLGAVIRATEADFALVECLAAGNQCVVTKPCKLPAILNEALTSFLTVFDNYTLANIVLSPQAFGAAPQSPDRPFAS
tara:strand:+ start:1451 stop:1900 length:450 start_codon:yes stop_codon:yes gene_type:complete